MRIIAGVLAKGKRVVASVPEGVLTAGIVILACSFSFGLGAWYGTESKGGEVVIEQIPLTKELSGEVKLHAAPAATISAKVTTPEPVSAGGQYVASKKGTKYHLPWCSGAKAMSEENKVWFDSKEAAEAAGYTPASNCKGI